MRNLLSLCGFFALLVALNACAYDDGPEIVQGYRPIYNPLDIAGIALQDAQPVRYPGKIYRYGAYLLINEYNRGIHLFDNKNPAAPVPIGFIHILGNRELAIRDNVLYVDHLNYLVALGIDDFNTLVKIGSTPLGKELDPGRVMTSNMPPPPKGYYFDCVDPLKGYVTGWEPATLENPSCYAPK
jgi:hypothetical protein